MPLTSILPVVGGYNPSSSLARVLLPAPFLPTNCDSLSWSHGQVKRLENQLVGAGVGEGHTLELDLVSAVVTPSSDERFGHRF